MALNTKERAEADKDHAEREQMPGSAFLEPNSRKYPVKVSRDGEWKFDRDLLTAAESEAAMHGHADLAAKAKEIRDREFPAAHDAMIAFDRSARSVDADGRLHVAMSNISKATVNPYYGREIPGYADLGLSAEKIYNLLRAPDELQKGAATFNNLQLLSRHVPVSADDPQKNIVVGSTGTDAQFSAPYLRNSLVVWDAEAIAGIESREQCELSCAYRYVPDMTPGTFEGVAYDGVMTQIVGNHVALVEVGRAGPDVVVSDSNPFIPEQSTMKQRNRKTVAVRAALKAYLRPVLAADSAMDINQLVGSVKAATIAKDAARIAAAVKAKSPSADAKELQSIVMDAAAEEDDEAEDEDDEEEKKRKEEAAKKAKDDEAEEKAKKDEAEAGKKANAERDDKKAMDAAIKNAESAAVARMTAIRQAERDVQPIVGDIAAMDSAESVYKFALDHAGVDTSGVHPSAYPALVRMHLSRTQKPAIAQDSASSSSFWKDVGDSIKLPARS